RADDGDAPARGGRGGARERRLAAEEQRVGGVALEGADGDRGPALVVEDAGALAEHLDRAHARAGAAEEVLGEDRARRAAAVADREGAHEAGDVDPGG